MDKLFNADYLRHLCQLYGLAPSKKYGQNFLISEEPILKMIEAAGIKKTDTVVEVGPGFGVLTFALAAEAKKVLAFEIEKKLAPYWEKATPCHPEPRRGEGSLGFVSRDSSSANGRTQNDSNIEIIWGNVLKEVGSLKLEAGKYKVVANLPYQITSPVIRTFLEADNPPESMTLMVQKEVAERICAEPGDMSMLSVSVQYYAEPTIVAIVPRENFWPEPKVDSAIIKLLLRSRRPKQPQKYQESDGAGAVPPSAREGGGGEREFFRLVKAGFANRRKLLIKNLLPVIGKQNRGALEQALASLGLSKTVRAQELSVEQWRKLAERVVAQ